MSGVEIQAHGRTLAKQKTLSPTFIYTLFSTKGGEALLIADCVLGWVNRETEGSWRKT
jgi:hypothetical protein